MQIGPEELSGKERRFVPARGRFDFDDDVFRIVRVGRQQGNLDLLLQFRGFLLKRLDVRAEQVAHFRVFLHRQHLVVFREFRKGLFPAVELLKQGAEFAVLLRNAAELCPLRVDRRVGQAFFELSETPVQILDVCGYVFWNHET